MQFHQKSIRKEISESFGNTQNKHLSLNLTSNSHNVASIKLPFSSFSSSFCHSQIVAGISVFFICTSVISFCLKTLPAMRVEIPMTTNISNNTGGGGGGTAMNISDFYQASTTEANFILTTTQRPSGLFNRYSVNNSHSLTWHTLENYWPIASLCTHTQPI